MTRDQAIELLLSSSAAMHASGLPLMRRVLPRGVAIEQWAHYPAGDVVNGPAESRYFYHCHPPDARCPGDHGHFHLFLGKRAMPPQVQPWMIPLAPVADRPDLVHLAALAIDDHGLPTRWFTVNRWVTDEWLYPADVIARSIARFDVRGATGDPEVNQWLTALVVLSAPMLSALLIERDRCLNTRDPGGEDRSIEITSSRAIDLEQLLYG